MIGPDSDNCLIDTDRRQETQYGPIVGGFLNELRRDRKARVYRLLK